MLRATWYEETAQLLSLTEFKSHLFELYFIGWTIKPITDFRKSVAFLLPCGHGHLKLKEQLVALTTKCSVWCDILVLKFSCLNATYISSQSVEIYMNMN